MKYLAGFILACFTFVPQLRAQVEVELELDQKQFLPCESFPVAVRITNRSGQPIKVGGQTNWLSFAFEPKEGGTIEKIADLPIGSGEMLQSALTGTIRLDLAKHYEVDRVGNYTLTAIVRLPNWDESISSPPVKFDVVSGTRLWEQVVGVPAQSGQPGRRKYILTQTTYFKRMMLFMRVTDESETRTRKLFALGNMVSFGHPEAMIDKESRVHVLNQCGSREFQHTVMTPSGEMILRQYYETNKGLPRLRLNNEGVVNVEGGTRRTSPQDIPSANKINLTNESAPSSP